VTRLNWYGLGFFFGTLVLWGAANVVYDAVMHDRHQAAGTISTGMGNLARVTPLFAAAVGYVAGAVTWGLLVHWFEKV